MCCCWVRVLGSSPLSGSVLSGSAWAFCPSASPPAHEHMFSHSLSLSLPLSLSSLQINKINLKQINKKLPRSAGSREAEQKGRGARREEGAAWRTGLPSR